MTLNVVFLPPAFLRPVFGFFKKFIAESFTSFAPRTFSLKGCFRYFVGSSPLFLNHQFTSVLTLLNVQFQLRRTEFPFPWIGSPADEGGER